MPDITQCDYLKGSDELDACLQNGIRAVQSTPLLSRSGTLIGMLSTHWGWPHSLNEQNTRHLDILARMTSDLIDRRHKKAEREQLIKELTEREALHKAIFDNAPEGIVVCEMKGDVSGRSHLYGLTKSRNKIPYEVNSSMKIVSSLLCALHAAEEPSALSLSLSA